VIRAENGKKYDCLFLEYDWTHHSTGVHNGGQITEKYVVMFPYPTGTGAALITLLETLIPSLGTIN
jgi:hypothetical protein